MKAWVLHRAGRICLEDVPNLPLAPGEARIRVKAAGVCGSDIPRVYETGAHRMPLVPGHEFSGVVDELGGDVPDCWRGKRVGVYPLIPCGKCQPCNAGHPEMCMDYDYIGSRRDGAFAEYVTVPVRNLMELPESVNFEEAAMLEPMAVAAHAMRMALGDGVCSPHRDARITVCGAGTIGLLLSMLLIENGFPNLSVVGNKEGQRKRAENLGIAGECFCDSRKEDAAEWIRKRIGGADVLFECVGRPECVSLCIDAAAPGARIVLVGNPAADIALPRNLYWKILRRQLILRGTWNSRFSIGGRSEEGTDDWSYVLERLRNHRIKPAELITHRYHLEELETGLCMMRNKTEDFCKVMIAAEAGDGA